jgi:hypothetical protein
MNVDEARRECESIRVDDSTSFGAMQIADTGNPFIVNTYIRAERGSAGTVYNFRTGNE